MDEVVIAGFNPQTHEQNPGEVSLEMHSFCATCRGFLNIFKHHALITCWHLQSQLQVLDNSLITECFTSLTPPSELQYLASSLPQNVLTWTLYIQLFFPSVSAAPGD